MEMLKEAALSKGRQLLMFESSASLGSFSVLPLPVCLFSIYSTFLPHFRWCLHFAWCLQMRTDCAKAIRPPLCPSLKAGLPPPVSVWVTKQTQHSRSYRNSARQDWLQKEQNSVLLVGVLKQDPMHRLAVPCRVSSCCVKEVGSERSSQLLVDPATEETVRSDICIEEGGGGRRLSVGGRERLSGMTCFILVYLKSRSQMFLLRAAVRAASIFPECAVSSLVDAVMFRMGMKAIVAFTVFDKGWKHRKFTARNPDSHFLTPPPNPHSISYWLISAPTVCSK